MFAIEKEGSCNYSLFAGAHKRITLHYGLRGKTVCDAFK